jgi:hypothetical protein
MVDDRIDPLAIPGAPAHHVRRETGQPGI